MEMSSPEPPTLSQMNTDSDSDLGNESDLISSQEHQLAPETVEHRNRVGADFEMFCKSRRWGPTQIRSLRGYVRHLFKNKKFAPTTVSTEFSLLRPYLQKVHHATFDAVELKPVFQYIDAKLKNHVPKKAKVLSQEQMLHYLKNGPNSQLHSRHKLLIFIDIFTAGRGSEILKLKWEDIAPSDLYDGWAVTLHRSKCAATEATQKFLLPSDPFEIQVAPLFTLYQNLTGKSSGPLWLSIDGSPICRTTLMEATRHSAKFIGLHDWKEFTGHGLRSFAAQTLADNGATEMQIMQFGNWKTGSAARGYLRQSPRTMAIPAELITGKSLKKPHQQQISPEQQQTIPEVTVPRNSASEVPSIFTGCQISTVTIHIHNHPN